MEFTKPEMQAIESTVRTIEEAVVELNELELACIAGGSGAVSLG